MIMDKNVDEFMNSVITGLQREQRHGTARLYVSVQRVLRSYPPYAGMTFDDFDTDWLNAFECWLSDSGKRCNTTSTYIRVLRAVYNRAYDQGLAAYHPRLFHRVYTGVSCERKLALDVRRLCCLFYAPVDDPVLSRTRDFCLLMFLLHGMPFVDLVYLRRGDYRNSYIVYRRRKTGTHVEVLVNGEAHRLITRLRSHDDSPYLFDFLRDNGKQEGLYEKYRRALRTFNGQLKRLAAYLNLGAPLSTYTMRHSWGTLAYHMEVHPGVISQALGHSSIEVTETYLKPFVPERIEKINRQMIKAIKKKSLFPLK